MELVTGERERKFMKKKIIYTDEPIQGKVVKDFLPRPENLVFIEKKKRVTLTLSENSLDFFKKAAKKHKASYQSMIRKLVDHYVASQQA